MYNRLYNKLNILNNYFKIILYKRTKIIHEYNLSRIELKIEQKKKRSTFQMINFNNIRNN